MKKKREGIPQGIRFDVFRRDNFTCRYCGRSSPAVVLHCDHVKPHSKGGEIVMENLVTACADCNLGKLAKELDSIPEVAQGSLVGFWGITLKNGVLDGQFKIIQKLDENTYLIQMFEWLMGQPSTVESQTRSFLLNPETCKLWVDREAWIDGKYIFEYWADRLIDADSLSN